MKKNVTFLLDPANLWMEDVLKNYNFKQKNRYNFKITKNSKSVKNQDIVFPICYTRILPNNFLNINKLVLIVHPSKLPQNKGFAATQHEILKNKNKIFVTMIKAEKKPDNGPICLQDYFNLNGTELISEIRRKQSTTYLRIIKFFLNKYPKVSFRKQKGKENFIKRRTPKDSELNINKSIKDQFNHLRINDNDLYPSFFYYKKTKYLLKIFKDIKKK